MTTRKYLCPLTFWRCFTLAFALQSLSATEQTNVVFILIDDLSHYGVSAYGATQLNSTQVDSNSDPFFPSTPVATPQIDRLADDGLLAGNAFAYAICEPTRVALMTGMNNNRNYIQTKALHESQITFGDIFKQAGYATGIAGKWKQSRGTAAIPGKDYVDQFGWDDIYCFDVVGEGSRHIDPNFVINGAVTFFNNNRNGGIDPDTGRRWYGPDLINRFALNFIEAHQNEPFFLYYSMLLVHDEHTPTPDTEPQSIFDNWQAGYAPQPADNEYGSFKGDDRRYFPDMVAYMDKMIGNIIDKLDALNLRENTLIVLMGDNGTKSAYSYTLPDSTVFVGGKGECRANGLQVPLLLSQPGTISAGIVYNGLINLTDIFPTICEAAGLEIPNADDLDGISFWPQVLDNTAAAHRDHIYTWYNANKPMTDTTKLIQFAQEIDFKRYAPDENNPPNFPQGRFFDLRTDPLELVDAYNNTVDTGLGILLRSGLDLAALTTEQQAAYDRLGLVLANNTEVAATGLGIETTFATVRYSTQFEGSEGFQSGGINNSANFNESSAGGMYLPGGQAPVFGTLQRSPTAGSSQAFYNTGAGASFGVGATWSTTLDFTFEGLPNTAPGTTTQLVANGFSSSNTANANVMYAAIQKGGGQIAQYQFFISGGGFLEQNIPYADIGDDTLDNDDLTDTLRIEFTLTKSAITGQFDAVATLTNLDTNTIVATISNSLNRPDAYSPAKNLYGYINSGAVQEAGNFDLLNIDSFTYTATPEPSDQSMSSGKVRINDSVQLQAQVTPANATMRNVVWQSSDSTIATVDKFGIATALQPGEATISLYSWEDARPLASGSSATLDTTGISEQVTIVVNPPLIHTDDDSDGIEDSWENTYFSDLSTVDASSDIDNDGNTDAAEFQAGTDPTDRNSSFRINIQDVSTDFDLSWPSASGRTYSIRMTTDLGQPWTVVENTIAATPPTNSRSFTHATGAAFYQITID